MKISDFGHWYKLYALTANSSFAKKEGGDLALLLEKASALIKDDTTNYIRIHKLWNGVEVWQTKADFKKKRWDIETFTDLSAGPVYVSWCDKNKISAKFLEIDGKLGKTNI